MLQHFSVSFDLVRIFKCLDRFLEHDIIYHEIPFGFLTTSVMLKNGKQILTIFFYNNMMIHSIFILFYLFFP
jgi:hypothetical protein